MKHTNWFDLAKSIIRGELVSGEWAKEFIDTNGGPPADLPLLHPAEHAWVERMVGRKLTNEEAQDAIRGASIAASLNYWVDGKVN
jgi:hypothetical protein